MANTTITLDKADLTRAMAHLTRIVERKGTIPILANVRLVTDESGVHVTATDLDIEACTHIECGVGSATSPGSAITVPASTLSEIARKLPEGAEITITWAAGETRASISAGRSRFSLQALPAEDFPDFARGEFTHSFDVPAETLTRLLAKVSFAMSTEETRYYLNGIHMHVKQRGEEAPVLVAVATNGHRLSKFEMPAPEGADITLPSIIIPAKTVAELARLAKDHKGNIRLHISAAKFGADIGNTRLNSKLVDGTFPDYERVIPRGNSRKASLHLAKLDAAVDLVSTVASEKGKAVKFTFTPGTLNLSVNNPDAGAAEDEIEAAFEGDSIEVGFNGRYVADLLTALASEHVEFLMADAASPCIIRNPADESVLTVLMPMRV